jgi:flagellar biosynthesis/type III secretory pathway chaperone
MANKSTISSFDELHNDIKEEIEIIRNKIKNCRQFGKENVNIVEKSFQKSRTHVM